jgi:hypothetical protein
MRDDDGRPMYPEGERVKPWELWRLRMPRGERHELVAVADTREGLPTKRRLDWHYGVYHEGKAVN